MTFQEMKGFEDKSVVLKCVDGELVTAKILFVDEEYQDVIADVKNTNKPETWPEGHPSDGSAYTIPLSDIIAVEEV